MLKVGITGGVGTGKSTVAKIFATLGIPVYEADSKAKLIIENNQGVISEIKNLLGENAYLSNGKYNNNYVKKLVFNNPKLLKSLNKIVHPAVGKDTEEWLENQKSAPYIIKEAAIMNKNSGLDKIIVVSSPMELRTQRISERDGRNISEIENIIKNQKSEKEFEEMADYLIQNNERDFLIPQVLKIDRKLREITFLNSL